MSTINGNLEEQPGRAEINLSHVSGTGLGLIILRSSEVFYRHETGGYTCYPAQDEGVFVPLHEEQQDQETLLTAFFTGPKWGGWCDEGIDEATAEYVDYVLSLSDQTAYLRVDRTRLAASREAWIYVDVLVPTDVGDAAPISGFGNCKGVFLWGNSD